MAGCLDALTTDFDGLDVKAPLGCPSRDVITSRHAAEMASGIGCMDGSAVLFEVFIGVGVKQLSHGYIMTRGCDSLD